MPAFYRLGALSGSMLWDVMATSWQRDNLHLRKKFLCDFRTGFVLTQGETAPKSFMGQECHKNLKSKNNFTPLLLFTSYPPSQYPLRAWKGREGRAKAVRKSSGCKTLEDWAAAASSLVAEF